MLVKTSVCALDGGHKMEPESKEHSDRSFINRRRGCSRGSRGSCHCSSTSSVCEAEAEVVRSSVQAEAWQQQRW